MRASVIPKNATHAGRLLNRRRMALGPLYGPRPVVWPSARLEKLARLRMCAGRRTAIAGLAAGAELEPIRQWKTRGNGARGYTKECLCPSGEWPLARRGPRPERLKLTGGGSWAQADPPVEDSARAAGGGSWAQANPPAEYNKSFGNLGYCSYTPPRLVPPSGH